MRKRTTALILAGALATGGVGAAVVIAPASAATSDNAVSSRLEAIKSALKGLVGDGTLTQAQADKVAGTLDTALPQRDHDGRGRGGGWFGKGMSQTRDAAATALGMSTEELRTAVQGGKTLAEVAKEKNVSVDALVKAMVAAAEKELSTAVTDGRITQAQADAMKGSLTQRITDRVNGVRGEGGHGPGHGHGRRGDGAAPSDKTPSPADSGSTQGTPSAAA